jgi:hypothetical protein
MSRKILVSGYSNSIHFYRWCGFLKSAGFNVEILSLIKNNTEYDYSKFDGFYDFSGSKGFLKKLKQLVYIVKSIYVMRKSDADFVNFHYLEDYILFIAMFINKKIVLTCWGSDILVKYKTSKGILRFLYNRAFKKAYAVTCDSESVKATIISGNPGIDPEKIKIVFWGIDTGLFNIPSAEEKNILRNEYKIPQNAMVLLSIRNVDFHYKIKDIIEQFNIINDTDIFLVVRVSPIKSESYLKDCRKESASNKNIIFIEEEIDYKNISKLYKISDIDLHFPVSDATPVSIFEGIACGNIIAGSKDISSYKELSKNYDIKLIELNELNSDFIRKILPEKMNSNREKLILLNSENVTIEKLKTLFER